jgi:D-cysteine desulfhydrase
MQEYADRLRSGGRKAYVVNEGGSNALGTWGYIKAADETLRQVKRSGIRIGGLVAAVGSGGTHSGLLLGTLLLKWNIPVWGINICDDRRYFETKIENEINETIERFRLKVRFKPSDIRIIDGYVGEGYGIAAAGVHELIRSFATESGIILEPVYTGKAFYGMLKEIDKGSFGKRPSLLFYHTGGVFGLLAGKYAPYYG